MFQSYQLTKASVAETSCLLILCYIRCSKVSLTYKYTYSKITYSVQWAVPVAHSGNVNYKTYGGFSTIVVEDYMLHIIIMAYMCFNIHTHCI